LDAGSDVLIMLIVGRFPFMGFSLHGTFGAGYVAAKPFMYKLTCSSVLQFFSEIYQQD